MNSNKWYWKFSPSTFAYEFYLTQFDKDQNIYRIKDRVFYSPSARRLILNYNPTDSHMSEAELRNGWNEMKKFPFQQAKEVIWTIFNNAGSS